MLSQRFAFFVLCVFSSVPCFSLNTCSTLETESLLAMYLQHVRLFKLTSGWQYFGMEKCKCRGAAGVYLLLMFLVFCHWHPCRVLPLVQCLGSATHEGSRACSGPSELLLLLLATIAVTLLSLFEVDISREEDKKPKNPNEGNNPTGHDETSL